MTTPAWETGQRPGDADPTRGPRVAAARVAAVTALVVGGLTVLVRFLPDDPLDVPLLWHVLAWVSTGITGALVLVIDEDSSPASVEWRLRAHAWLLVGLLVSSIWADAGGSGPLAYVALGLIVAAVILRRRDAAVLLAATAAAAAVLVVAVSAQVGPDLWALGAVIGIGAIAIVASAAQRRALARESRLRREAVAATAALTTVLEAARATASLDVDTVLQAIVDSTRDLGAAVAGVFLREDDGHLALAISMGFPHEATGLRVAPGELLTGEAFVRRRTIVVDDYAAYHGRAEALVDLGVRSALATPLTLSSGRVIGVLMVGRSDRESWTRTGVIAYELLAQHAAQALQLSLDAVEDRELLNALQERHDRGADIVATVSHELRTPLTVIGGLTSTLVERADDISPELRRDLLERVAANAGVLSTIVEDMLDHARLAGGLRAVEDRVPLHDLASLAIKRLMPLAEDHELRLVVEAEPVVIGDRSLLGRVLDNLVTNALRHTPAGTTVSVRVSQQDRRGVVTVEDDGPGIDPELLPRLTDRFVRGGDTATRDTRGLGIGLALVAEVLRLHGSTLQIDSVEGHGASFAFALPLADTVTSRLAGLEVPAPAAEDGRPDAGVSRGRRG